MKQAAYGETRTAIIKKKLMKTQNKIEEQAPANADQLSPKTELPFGETTDPRFLLAMMRMTFRNATPSEQQVLRRLGIHVFRHIEENAQSDSLWTSLPKEKELTAESRLGDHLSVTRNLYGFIA